MVQEVREPTVEERGKEAYVLAEQLEALHTAMKEAGDRTAGYAAFARNYNRHLQRAQEVLVYDPVIARGIVHLQAYNPDKETGYNKDFQQIKADLAVLMAALRSFFVFHFPAKEKERIGFVSR